MAIVWYLTVFSGCFALLFINPDLALKSMLDGAQNSVNATIKLTANYGFWLGFFALVDKIGLCDKLTVLLRPVVKFLFPNIKSNSEKFVAMNMSANLLGLGNASTPLAIKAINSMYEGKDYASTNMIMLTVISATSLQIIPTTVIGLRSAHGSLFPTAFLLPSVIATVFSTFLGITLVKIFDKILPIKAKKKVLIGSQKLVRSNRKW